MVSLLERSQNLKAGLLRPVRHQSGCEGNRFTQSEQPVRVHFCLAPLSPTSQWKLKHDLKYIPTGSGWVLLASPGIRPNCFLLLQLSDVCCRWDQELLKGVIPQFSHSSSPCPQPMPSLSPHVGSALCLHVPCQRHGLKHSAGSCQQPLEALGSILDLFFMTLLLLRCRQKS